MQLLFPLLLVGLCSAFHVSRRDLPWAVAVSGVAYLGILAGSSVLNANLRARRIGRPNSIVLIPVIVMLVSGTIGFRGLASMAGGDVLLGVQESSPMFVIAMTIVLATMLRCTIVRPEPSL